MLITKSMANHSGSKPSEVMIERDGRREQHDARRVEEHAQHEQDQLHGDNHHPGITHGLDQGADERGGAGYR